MDRELEGVVFTWRGPAPFHFVAVPEDVVADLQAVAPRVSYGWGMIPVRVTIGSSTWETSLWPREGGYVVPLRARFRAAEHIEVDDVVRLRLEVAV